MFEKFLKRSSWTDIVISLIFVLFGILLVSKPEETVSAISIVLGIVFIAMGILKLIEYFTSERKADFLLTIALVSIIFGVIIMFWSDSILSVFRVILGIWIIVTGIMDLQTTIIWKETKSPFWMVAITFSILMILAGMIIIAYKDILVTAIGIVTIVYAILDIIDRLIFIKKIDNYKKD